MAHAFAYVYTHKWLAAVAVLLVTIFGDDRGCGGGGRKHWPRVGL